MRNPLTELALDKFIPSEHTASLKRPRSPSSAVLLSPTKRRILSSEGLFSPEKKRYHSLPNPQSPSKKLDFTAPDHPPPRNDALSRPGTPVSRPTGSPQLQPSPTIASSSSDASITISHSTTSISATMLIPREIPPVPDRQSIHWPGFDVYADTHIIIPTPTSTPPTVTPDDPEVDGLKENIWPKKRARKRATVDEGKPTKLPKMAPMLLHDSETFGIMSMLTPSNVMIPQEKLHDKKDMRLLMEIELDDEHAVDYQL